MYKKIWILIYIVGLSICTSGQSYLSNYQISYSGDYIVSGTNGVITKFFNPNFKNDLNNTYQHTYNSISNNKGNLILFTDGYRIFNSSGVLLEGSLKPNLNQSIPNSVIAPIPNSNDRFLIITSVYFNRKLYFQEIILNSETGIGKVIKTDSINNFVPFNLGLYQHCNPNKKWLIMYEQFSYRALAYEINENGINLTPIISNFYVLPNVEKANLIFSPDSKKILINFITKEMPLTGEWYIIKFDQKTGLFYDPEGIMVIKNNNNNIHPPFLPCFSPKGQYVYFKNLKITQPNSPIGYSEISRYSIKNKTFELVYQSAIGMYLFENYIYSISQNNLTYLAGNSWFKATTGNHSTIENGRYFGVFDADNSDAKKVVIKDYLSKSDTVLIRLNYSNPIFNYKPFDDADLNISTACKGSPSIMKVNTSTEIDAITWDFGDGIIQNELGTSVQHYYRDTGNFCIKSIIFSCGRIDTLRKDIFIEQAPDLSGFKDTAICTGSFIIFSVNGNGKIKWNNGDTTPIIKTGAEGLYTVTLSNACGIFQKQARVTLIKPFQSIPEKEIILCKENEYLSPVQTAPNYTWNTNESTREILVRQPGKYWVNMDNGCFTTQEQFIVIKNDKPGNITFPNAVTVNGDGLNDVWLPIFINMESVEFKIYSRWGELLFDSPDGKTPWIPEKYAHGVYFYMCNYKEFCTESKLSKGNVTILK
ncbi:MAG: gliding motility-associated C-terminal domain-containing protein [Bacteroidota bacterium]|nr:gliding motility-associated C-terminal domain-containing protein [Bacteroidota bacterium]